MDPTPREQANAAVRKFLSGHDWSTQTPTRQRILAAFLHLAAVKGVNAVTMRTMGRELDMKAPSLYSSFPRGKDEIVAESLRWFTHGFARDLLEAVESTNTPEDYWAALVRVHLSQQLQRPEADLWDLLIATDRAARFLSDDARTEANQWLRLHEDMFSAAAREMGYRFRAQTVRVILALLDGAGRWVDRSVSDQDFAALTDRAVALTLSILEIDTQRRSTDRALSQAGTTLLR